MSAIFFLHFDSYVIFCYKFFLKIDKKSVGMRKKECDIYFKIQLFAHTVHWAPKRTKFARKKFGVIIKQRLLNFFFEQTIWFWDG